LKQWPWSLGVLLVFGLCRLADGRDLPKPLASHPGNIFLEGDEVRVAVPSTPAMGWQLLDCADQVVAEPQVRDGEAGLGPLPVGFYRLKSKTAPGTNWVSLGVLAPLRAATPRSSPVALDVATSWFYPPEKMETVASLCALAGVNWVRDRLTWGQMEPQRGQFAATNQYAAAAHAQSRAGLQVLQVLHASPAWANPDQKRFPLDLRDAYRFYREMARRWAGQVRAFEPWNEADISVFGGHTGSEMAALQKAAYLGLKAGNQDVIACLNVFATHRRAHLEDLQANEVWPYFDTFNLHHYEAFEQYPSLYADFRAASAGRPLWVTECALPVKWAGDAQLQEPTEADLRVQAEHVAKTFSLSLHEGSAATFYFLLPHYVEGQTQFGILRRDLTPRPAFVALAAVGRLLADARPLGRLRSAPTQQAYLFDAKPDGTRRQVLVAWDTTEESRLALPARAEAVFDHFGRPRQSGGSKTARHELTLGTAPVFAVLTSGALGTRDLAPPPPTPARLPGAASPIVLQALWPEAQVVLNKSAYRLADGKTERLPVWAYNFSPNPARGQLRVVAPSGWKCALPKTVELAPGERTELAFTVNAAGKQGQLLETIRITGDFGPAGKPVLSMRVMNPGASAFTALPEATQAKRWQPAVSSDGQLVITNDQKRLVVDARCAGSNRWAYPTLPLNAAEVPPSAAEALALTFTLAEGAGQFRVIFEEANGSAYVADFVVTPRVGETVEALAFFEGAVHGSSWSKPDPNHRLDADQIRVIKVGCNTSADRVRYSFGNLRWIHSPAQSPAKTPSAPSANPGQESRP
jgi:hypothetical protein